MQISHRVMTALAAFPRRHAVVTVATAAAIAMVATFSISTSIRADETEIVQAAEAVQMTQSQVTIVGTALGPDGYLTRDMHSVFWDKRADSAVRAAGGIENYARVMESDLLRRVDLMYEMWRSAEQSWAAGDHVETPEFVMALEHHRALADVTDRLAQLGARQDSAAMTQIILMAATSGEQVRDGDEPMLDHTVILTGLASRPGAEGRARVLAAQNWSPTPVTVTYPGTPISLKTAWPFTPRPTAHDGVRLTQQVDRVSSIEVRYLPNATGTPADVLAAAAASSDIAIMASAESTFRGAPSATLQGTREIKDGTLAIRARAIALGTGQGPNRGAIVLIVEAGRGGDTDARARLAAFEAALTLSE